MGVLRSPTTPPPVSAAEGAAPLLSVVIPAWKASWCIGSTLQSLKPSPSLLEVIVIENGSSELSRGFLKSILPGHTVKLIRLPQADLSTARNVGLSEASAVWVLFLDADDIIDIGPVTNILESLTPSRTEIFTHGNRIFTDSSPTEMRTLESLGPHDERISEPDLKHQSGPNYILQKLARRTYSPVTGGFVFKRQVLNATNVRFSEGFLHEDHAFVGALLAQSRDVVSTDAILFYKRNSETSLSRTMPVSKSLLGYQRAVIDLLQATKSLTLDSPLAPIALRWLVSRLETIVALKRIKSREEAWPSRFSAYASAILVTLRHLGFSTVSILAWVFLSISGAKGLVALRRNKELSHLESQTSINPASDPENN